MKLSPHFDSREFACRHCGRSEPTTDLIAHLELLRAQVRRPIIILSGYRCPAHNAAVGGARRSQHMLGAAADLHQGVATVAQARAAGFTGIGYRGVWAVHVDVRPGRLRTWAY